jgi:hypothetical protein
MNKEETEYEKTLDSYLEEGICYDTNTICKAD